jgi:hypothetical protein
MVDTPRSKESGVMKKKLFFMFLFGPLIVLGLAAATAYLTEYLFGPQAGVAAVFTMWMLAIGAIFAGGYYWGTH